ncbi:MAG: hypothetical protein FWF81_15315 [Defluviitaleaceae bacterium]|nr:hypothetical protein [Defluviitaleaceae bacterium]
MLSHESGLKIEHMFPVSFLSKYRYNDTGEVCLCLIFNMVVFIENENDEPIESVFHQNIKLSLSMKNAIPWGVINMKDLKKKLSLYMALLMVMSLFAPFSVPLQVYAIDPDLSDMGAQGGALLATFHGRLMTPLGTPQPRLDMRVAGAPVTTQGNVMLNWALPHTPANWQGDMDLLRFFDQFGRRHELSVKQITDYAGTIGLMVNYDIYIRRFDSTGAFVGYRHIGDPLFPAGAAGGFGIYVPGIGFEQAPLFFSNARNEGTDNLPLGVRLNRVNNRSRFMVPENLSPLWPANDPTRFTPTHPHFLDPIYNPNDVIPATDQIFYQRLSPSFNISENMGYSFRFGGHYAHFLWRDGQFYFYIENLITGGAVHEFVLERYTVTQAEEYFRGLGGAYDESTSTYFFPSIQAPAPNLPQSANPLSPADPAVHLSGRAIGRIGNVYVTVGVNNETLNTIPFAQNISDAGDYIPHARNTHLVRENSADPPRGPLAGDSFLSGAEPVTSAIAYPTFDIEPLDMTTRPYPIQPATPNVGIDIRFNLPGLFDEAAGDFSNPIASNQALYNSLEVWLQMNIGGGPSDQDFEVRFNMRDLSPYGVNAYNNAPGEILPEDTHAILHDLSLLTRQAQLATPDRVRVKVGGLAPSLAYTSVFLDIVAMDVALNLLSWAEAEVATPLDPFYTFLNYEFTEQAGRPFIRVEPFNHSVGRVRQGYYQLVGLPAGMGGYAIQRADAGITTFLYFPLPYRIPGSLQRFHVTQSETSPILGTPSLRQSQEVWWSPDDTPNVSLPDNFTISNVLNRPVRGDIHAGALTFTASWDIGIMANIVALVESFENDNEFLELTYMMGQATSPESQLTNPYHFDYILVQMQIRRNPVTEPPAGSAVMPSPLLVRYAGSFAQGGQNSPVHNWSHFNDPIVNNGRVPHSINNPVTNPGWSDDGWQELGFRTDPSTAQQVFFASIDIETDSIRRYRPVPPPPTMRREFSFPGLYFLNVRLDDWNLYANPSHTWSRFDYIVVNDVGELAPPPPVNLQVTGSRDYEAPPELSVSFAFPSSAIRNYLETMYEMEVQLWANMYIGQFENAIMDTFFFGPAEAGGLREEGRPLYAGYRTAAVSLDVPFSEVYSFNAAERRMELDLSDPQIQSVLRGEGGTGAGVIRILDIPVITTTLPAELIGEWINFDYPDGGANIPAEGSIITETPEIRHSFDETARIIGTAIAPQPNYNMTFHLLGVDENRAYFVFADLAIQKFVQDEENELLWEIREGSPGVSDLTGVATDTTVGTPAPPPGPGDVPPPAPTGLGVRDVEQMSATVYWDPMPLTAEQVFAGTRIEWEIIRVHDGARLTQEQMLDNNPNFVEVLSGLADSPARKGWITDGITLTVMPENELIAEPNESDYYRYHPGIVELTDKTLLPNQLYFYYVRTVRIDRAWDHQLDDYVEVRSVSVWEETTVTTTPIEPPINLRQEDPGTRADFCGETMVFVSWEHIVMPNILEGMGEYFLFQYQLREGEGQWGEVMTVTVEQMIAANLCPYNPNRIRYLITGLEHSTIYQLRVRLHDVVSSDNSLWSNTITFLTDINQDDIHIDREIDDWLRYLRRRLEELLRRPFWTAQVSPYSHVMVYRPAEVFDGLMQGTIGTDIRLHNDGQNRIVYYMPAANVFTANENRHGFSTAFPDMEFLLAPSLLTDVTNQAVIDMARAIDARGSQLSDSFVRIEIVRRSLDSINGVDTITPSTEITMEMVGTNTSIRNLRTWDQRMHTIATRIIESWLADPIIRQGFRDQLVSEHSNEDISDQLYHIISRVEAEINHEVNRFMTRGDIGIVSVDHQPIPITEFDSAMHVVATGVDEDSFVSGYSFINSDWRPQTLVEHHNGRAFVARRPGTFAFTGRVVEIPGIETVPRGGVVTGIVARYGLEDLFGLNVDLYQNANRQMVVGSIARMAGVPRNADAFAWVNANLNVTMTGRNATGLISQQEAIAMTMALYEHRTGTRINTIRIHNHRNTAGMTLDNRHAQAVRAAFELGLVTHDTFVEFDPAGAITIGEFLDMLSILSARIRV